MTYTGNPVSAGIAVGAVYRFTPWQPQVRQAQLEAAQVNEALARYRAAQKGALAELEALIARLEAQDAEKAAILRSHQDILTDAAMDEDICAMVEDELAAPEWAVLKVHERYAALLAASADELIRERAADLRDARDRLLRVMAGAPEQRLSALPGPVIVVTRDLAPSQTAVLDRQNVLGIVTEVGGPTSHCAIIARSYGIPAVLGVAGATAHLRDGQRVILDALDGRVIADPTGAELAEAEKKEHDFIHRMAEVRKYRDIPPRLRDGTEVAIHLNLGSADARELEASAYTDGVGLFRSEFLYMGQRHLPTEEAQLAAYRKVLTEFAPRPVILRTLDIGGDKKLEYMELPREDNPFLGLRALRLCFDRPELFTTQLRAALRASVAGNLWIMLPMVSSLDDIRRARSFIAEVRAQLLAEGHAVAEDVKIGVMIETPALAVIADLAAKEVDFGSIGTNDLTQYALAVDRMAPGLTDYYQSYHPAVFRLIGQAAAGFAAAGKPLGVCGELAGDALAAPVLVGLGIQKLSMNASAVAGVKRALHHLDLPAARRLAETVCALPTAAEVEACLKKELGA